MLPRPASALAGPILASLATVLLGLPAATGQSGFTPGRLYVLSRADNTVYGFDGPDAAASMQQIAAGQGGMAIGPDGNLYTGAFGTGRIVVYDAAGNELTTIGADVPPQFDFFPRSLAFGPNGHLYAGSDISDPRIFQFAPSVGEEGIAWSFVRAFGEAAEMGSFPQGLAFGPNGHLFVTARNSDFVAEVEVLRGNLVRRIGEFNNLDEPMDLAFGPGGNLFVTSRGTDNIFVFDPGGAFLAQFGSTLALKDPWGVAFGPDGHIYVADNPGTLSNHRVLRFDAETGQFAPMPAWGQDIVEDVRNILFAPQRFSMKVKGKLTDPDEKGPKLKEEGVVSLLPGTRRVMLHLDPAGQLTGLVDSPFMVFFGFEGFLDAPKNRKGVWQLWSMPRLPAVDGVASLQLDVKGKTDDETGHYVLKKAKGVFQFSSGAATLAKGKLTSRKPVD